MQARGDQLLARAALADDQHRTVQRRRAARLLKAIEKLSRPPDDLLNPIHSQELGYFTNSLQASIWHGVCQINKINDLPFGTVPALPLVSAATRNEIQTTNQGDLR